MNRKPIIASTGLLALILLPLAAYFWYFREVEHARVASTDGRWVVVVTKRMERFPEPVEVRLKVIQNWESPRVWLDGYLDAPDLWSDVKLSSYQVVWTSTTEFRVGWREPDEAASLLGRLEGQVWVVEPIKMPKR